MRIPEDRVVTFITMSEMGGVHVLSREEFLRHYPHCWQQLLINGRSMYVCADGQTLSSRQALDLLQVRAA
ncbi:MAG TPA: hypothetical protein V6D23_26675 [Candidatus Obscuribacterales bacterium]